MAKRLPTMWETRVQSLGREDLLEKHMATHSSILAWKIPWTEEPGRLQSMGSQRVGHDWATSLAIYLQYIPYIREFYQIPETPDNPNIIQIVPGTKQWKKKVNPFVKQVYKLINKIKLVLKILRDPQRTMLERVNEFSKVVGYKINISVVFLYTNYT